MENHHIVTLSPKGQFTVPFVLRRKLKSHKYIMKMEGEKIFLMPCQVLMNKKNIIVNQRLFEAILKLSDEARKVYNFIRKEAVSSNQIVENTGLNISQVSVICAELEFEELIKRNFSGWWEARL